jgi:ribonuclease P protein component
LYHFPKSSRLVKPIQFSQVFNFRKLRAGVYLKIHYKPNELGFSRLGLIVSKKNHKRSNKRNYMKRVIRELFRCNLPAFQKNANFQGYDLVVRINKYFEQGDFFKIEAEFETLVSSFCR